jgi:toxin ParE1/3/4
MLLRLTPLAEQDLESIADYIATDNPHRAITFVRELRQQCRRIVLNLAGYRLRPELGKDIRSCAYGHYVIFFEASASEVTIVRILHGARDLPAQFQTPDELS